MGKIERVLIVGGGLAGLALAIALRQRGLSVTIAERSSHGATSGAGLYLTGGATRALRALGIADDAARDRCVIRKQQTGQPLLHGLVALGQFEQDGHQGRRVLALEKRLQGLGGRARHDCVFGVEGRVCRRPTRGRALANRRS